MTRFALLLLRFRIWFHWWSLMCKNITSLIVKFKLSKRRRFSGRRWVSRSRTTRSWRPTSPFVLLWRGSRTCHGRSRRSRVTRGDDWVSRSFKYCHSSRAPALTTGTPRRRGGTTWKTIALFRVLFGVLTHGRILRILLVFTRPRLSRGRCFLILFRSRWLLRLLFTLKW